MNIIIHPEGISADFLRILRNSAGKKNKKGPNEGASFA
jgi:hypothetical protein